MIQRKANHLFSPHTIANSQGNTAGKSQVWLWLFAAAAAFFFGFVGTMIAVISLVMKLSSK